MALSSEQSITDNDNKDLICLLLLKVWKLSQFYDTIMPNNKSNEDQPGMNTYKKFQQNELRICKTSKMVLDYFSSQRRITIDI